MRTSRAPFAVAVFALSATCLFAQQSTASGAAQLPVYQAHARDVIVDVVVTNNHGGPVTGLHQQDFSVTEDGKPQSIDYFEEHVAKTLPPGALKPLPKMPPDVYTNVPPAPEDDAVNVLLLDTLNTDPRFQPYMRQQIIHFLLGMKPGTRIAIFALGTQLRYIQGFTTDTAALRAALLRFVPGHEPQSTTLSDIADEKEEIAILQSMNSPPRGASMGMGASAGISALSAAMAEEGGIQQANRMAMTLEAFQYLARYLGNEPDRKNLIWFSSSFPVNIFPSSAQMEALSNARGLNSEIKKTADMLTSSRVAVYPIEAEGMMEDHVAEADSRLETAGQGAGLMANLMASSSSRADTIYSMEQIASDTGGKAFYNSNDLSGAFNSAVTLGANYYTLVYSPTNKKMDGRFRRIEVKVPGEKYHLSYRRGYNADDMLTASAKSDADPLQPLMIRGLPGTTQILYAVKVVPADDQPARGKPPLGGNQKLTGPFRRYSVEFFIRWTDIKFATTANGRHTGKINVQLMAYDADGKAVNWLGGTQAMNIDPTLFASIQKSGVPAHIELDLPADKNLYLETGVYDENTGKAGTLEVSLPAGGAKAVAQTVPPTH